MQKPTIKFYNKTFVVLVVCVFYFLPLYSNAALTDGLVGYWTLDGKDTNWITNTITDRSGAGNAGTLVSVSTTTAPIQGKLGQAFRFDGTSSYINVGNNSSLNPATDMTVCLWVRSSDTSGSDSVIGKYDNTPSGSSWMLWRGNGANVIQWYTNGGVVNNLSSSAVVFNGVWHHVCGTLQGAVNKVVYVDGVASGSNAFGTTLQSNSTNVYIGSSVSSILNIGADIDDVRVYSRALSASEVSQLYKQGGSKLGVSPSLATSTSPSATGLSNGLVGYWTFDGKDSDWKTNSMADLSGQGNTATTSNMSTTSSPMAGKVGQALYLDGLNDSINISNPSTSFGATDKFSVFLWMKEASTTGIHYYTPLLNKINDNSSFKGFWFQRGGSSNGGSLNQSVQFGIASNFTTGNYFCGTGLGIGAGNVLDNNWHYVGFTYDGSQTIAGIRIYVDGIDDTAPITCGSFVNGSNTSNTAPIVIGREFTDVYFKGGIDDVRIYNRVVSPSEVKQLYNLGKTKTATSPKVVASTGRAGLSSGLVGYWTFDGKDTNWITNTTSDLSGNNNTGTLISFPTTTSPITGKLGQALYFSGSGSVVQIPNASNLNPSTITISAWVKTQTGAIASIVGKDNPGTSNRVWQFRAEANGTVTFIIFRDSDGSNSQVTSIISVNDNRWHLVTGSWDGSSIKIYIDGVLNNTSSYSGILQQGKTNNVFIGRDETGGGPSYFPGAIDDVRIYNRALSLSEINQLYKLGLSKVR